MINSAAIRNLFAAPFLIWAVLFIFCPVVAIAWYGLTDAQGAMTLANISLMTHWEYLKALELSIVLALISTVICLIVAYPLCLILTEKKRGKGSLLFLLFILPMWVNILVRTLATVALFDFADLPLGEGALLFGMVYNFIPFMIYPIYNTLQKMDRSYIEAAEDLGASPWQQFYKVILPLSMPGVASGILMVFMPTISTFAISELLTMNNIKLFGTTIQENINNSMWNYGAALSLIMLFLIGASTLIAGDGSKQEGGIR